MARVFGIAALIGAWCMFAPAAQSASPKPATLPAAGPIAVPAPQVLGQAVSHGSVRVSDAAAALLLPRSAPLGTPVSIVAG
jgi:hypothetical protein